MKAAGAASRSTSAAVQGNPTTGAGFWALVSTSPLPSAGHPGEALEAALEAAGLFRALEASLPGSFGFHLARTRQDLTSLLLDLPPGAPALAGRPCAAPRLSPSPR